MASLSGKFASVASVDNRMGRTPMRAFVMLAAQACMTGREDGDGARLTVEWGALAPRSPLVAKSRSWPGVRLGDQTPTGRLNVVVNAVRPLQSAAQPLLDAQIPAVSWT